MELSKIDKNFRINDTNIEQLKIYTIPSEPFDLYGVFYEKETERFVRMPSNVAKNISENVNILNSNTAGGRVRFSTDSDVISIFVQYNELTYAPHLSNLASSGFVLLEEREDKDVFVFSFMPNYFGNEQESKTKNGYSITKHISGGKVKNYILFFPNYNDISSLQIGFNQNSFVGHGKTYKTIKPIMYYGSSITQGACASRADNSYPAFISKWSNVDFVNLGFSGSCLAEDTMIDYLTSIECSIFVCDYDFNAPDVDYLEKTHFKIYENYRKKKPYVPIILVSNPDTDENFMQAKERFSIIKKTFEIAKNIGDKNIYLIEGSKLFGGQDRENCTVDGIHPNDLGFYKMAKEICKNIVSLLQYNL